MLQAPSFASQDQQRPLLPQPMPAWGFSASRLSANRHLRALHDTALSSELLLGHRVVGGVSSMRLLQHLVVTEL